MSEPQEPYDMIVHDLQRLLAQMHGLTGQEDVARLHRQCRRALEHIHTDAVSLERPIHVALVGGTGSGKSSLFNVLVGQENASPTSHMRPCTAQPYVACATALRPLVTLPPDVEWTFVPTQAMDNLVLIDTPDFNSVVLAHHDITRRVIELSDIIVFVVLPDQRADFAILGELERWKTCKHWFFVISKMDRERPEDHDKIRLDFDQRVRALGFEASDAARFLISTHTPEVPTPGLQHLRAVLCTTRPKSLVYVSRVLSALGWLERAIEASTVAALTQCAEAFHAEEHTLDTHMRTAYRQALTSPEVQALVADLALEQSWQQAARRAHGPIALALHLRNRLALFAVGFQLTRLLTGHVTLGRLLQVAGTSFLAAARGLLPAMQIADVLARCLGRDLETISTRAQHFIEDHGLGNALTAADTATESSPPVVPLGQTPQASDDAGAWWVHPRDIPRQVVHTVAAEASQRVVSVVETLLATRGPAAPLLEPLQHSLMQLGAETAQQAVRLPQQVLANSLPVLAGAHIVYRLVHGWIYARAATDYLPIEFYVMALTLFGVSCIPGYMWVAKRLRSGGARLDVEAVVAHIEHPSQTARIRDLRRTLQHVARDAARLRRTVLAMRREMAAELPHGFGIQSLAPESAPRG